MDIKEQYIDLAKQLGLEFKEGVNAFLESEVLQNMEGQMVPKEIPAFLKNEFLQKLLSLVFLGMVTGKYRDYEFFIYRGGTSSSKNKPSYHVKVNLAFPRKLGGELEIRPLDFLDRIYRFFFSGNIVLSGGREFDSEVLVTGEDKNHVRRLLESQETQEKLLHFFRNYPAAKISEHGVSYGESGEIIAAGKARKVMDDLVDIAKVFHPATE